MSHTLPNQETHGPSTATQRWMVVIFNNDHTPIEVVITTLMSATSCDMQEAEIEAWEAHHLGKAAVHFSSKAECDEVAAALQRVGVRTEVSPEWND